MTTKRGKNVKSPEPLRLAASAILVVALVGPACLAAGTRWWALAAGASAAGQRSVLDRGIEEPATPSPKSEPPAAAARHAPDPPAESAEAGQPFPTAREEEEVDEKKTKRKEEEEEEEKPQPRGSRSRAARTAGETSLDAPTDDEAEQQRPPTRKQEVYDVVHWEPSDRQPVRDMPIVLYPEYLSVPLPAERRSETIVFQRWTTAGTAKHSIPARQIVRIEYYERRVGKQAARELGLSSFEVLAEPGRVVDLSKRPESYDAAEELLRTALEEHDSAVQRGLRKGTVWNEKIRQPLVQALVNLTLGRVDQLIAQSLHQRAEGECDRLSDEFPEWPAQSPELRRRYDQILEARAGRALEQHDYATVRELLDRAVMRLDGQLDGAGLRVRERLVDEASRLFGEARALKESSPQEALDRLDEAARIWPGLPGLDDERRRMVGDYPILHCAYSELPRSLSPLEARTPVERHAASLVYESLVSWVDHPRSGSHYECRLAQGRPIPIERGRAFHLPRCFWADDERRVPCTVEDVRWTVKLLNHDGRPGYSPARARLLGGVRNSDDNDPRVALVTLQRDHWQPLSLMDFPVIPHPDLSRQRELQGELDRLRTQPMGTGPFRYVPDDDPDVFRLAANPWYRVADRPKIREVVFHRLEPTRAVDQFLQGRIHLIYGVQPKHVVQLRDQGRQVVCLKTPSVWFLAPNYRRRLPASRNVRLAVAHAVRREEILDQYFRVARGSKDHVALNGPYPAESWACHRKLSIYRAQDERQREVELGTAKALAGLARRELGHDALRLTLVYPSGSEEIQQACEQIRTHVGEVGVTLELVGVSPAAFYERIVDRHDFDLAYWRHDFEDSSYWLEPLLDHDAEARRPGGPNFMGYTPDADLAEAFARINRHKHFPTIQATTHTIHERIAREAVVVPLWQLGTYVAVAPGLHPKDRAGRAAALDPFDLFANVEHWELEAKP